MRRADRSAALLVTALLAATGATRAQDPLPLVNDSTTVSSIRFRFTDGASFPTGRLRGRMATRAPTFFGRLRNALSFLPLVTRSAVPFDPVELQRDMVRLGRFYRDNGFLGPVIDYPASQYNARSNSIGIIVTVREGPPLVVRRREAVFRSPLDPSLGRPWRILEERLTLRSGDRYTEFERVRLESRLLGWMRDRGYAFAEARVVALVDSAAHRVDLRMELSPGVRATIDRIEVEGDEAISGRVIRRQLPFGPGDLFRADALTEGQRALFGLNAFRVALADVPPQDPDSTVTVRVRVREAPFRLVSAEGGYSRENGLEFGSAWRHRNFGGDARQLSAGARFTSGLLASAPGERLPVRSAEATIALRQPYLGNRRLSGTGSIFYRWVDDPNQVVRYHEAGFAPSVLFQILPFRAATLQYSISRAVPIRGAADLARIAVFDRSVLSVSVAAGALNNYLHPRRGWMVRPSLDVAGLGLGGSVSYARGLLEATALVPITLRSSLWVSMTAGRLVPAGSSRDQSNPQVEYRFDPIRFYAGGATDVRGWALAMAGPKWVRTDSVYVDAEGRPRASGALYEAMGGLGKLSGRIEWRFPAPGLGDDWRLGTFLDFGGVAARVLRDGDGRTVFDPNGLPVTRDGAFPAWSDLRFGAGAGIRFLTPVGAIRFDAAWKLNPDALDLQSPADRALFEAGFLADPPERRSRRFAVHLSIDRVF